MYSGRSNAFSQFATPYPQQNVNRNRNRTIAFVLFTALYTLFLYNKGGAGSYLYAGTDIEVSNSKNDSKETRKTHSPHELSVASWNIAAINNNPFEYWLTIDDNPNYNELMIKVEQFIDNPTDETDIPVSQIFTHDMFDELESRMTKVAGWESIREFWVSDYSQRKIVTEFLKDTSLGDKRLASMPDRITNTINIHVEDPKDGTSTACRPTVINMYDGDLSTLQKWWSEWQKFMFEDALSIRDPKTSSIKHDIPFQMLKPIPQSKYPSITDEEERLSLPLQTLCCAIFDAILVHMMNTASSPSVWQRLKSDIVNSLNKQKIPNTLKILETTYGTSDIITLQEVSSSFIQQAKDSAILGARYHVIYPTDIDPARDQNSVILLKKSIFPDGSQEEVTDLATRSFDKGISVPVAKGDLLAITAVSNEGVPFVICSFHGDTNGLATIPVVDAVMKAIKGDVNGSPDTPDLSKHRLIFGLDANTYETGVTNKKQGVTEFGEHYSTLGLNSCWGSIPDPKNYTTFNARTYLQPQLNKACKSTDKRAYGDINPKDFILFRKDDFIVSKTWKDNTGDGTYTENMAFPTLDFPSDHGILATILTTTKKRL